MTDLTREIGQIREEALELGAAMASGSGRAEPESEPRARELFERLTELWPQVDTAPLAERDRLVREWTDARLDLTYVLSGGTAPTSLRLGHRLPKP